ncbi:long-chain fatty acid--CoA ligase [Rhodococcus rhodnii]|uniref:Acyl-CoA synthetase n=1 Tax=Rhodococcus rhodnii TaxID=38312 RepID=A0A6P2CG22_9NOCA|nr:long-chain fatty acid--CoA ligase [Rhodococcus rhodnii]
MRETSRPVDYAVADHENVVMAVFAHAQHAPERVLFSRPEADGWTDVVARDVAALVTGVAKGLVASGVEPGDRVLLLAPTSFEWSLLDYAIWAAGAVSVPVYPSSSPEQIRFIASDSESRVAVVQTDAQRDAVRSRGTPEVLVLDDDAVGTLIVRGRDLEDQIVFRRALALGADDLATIVYTSGTTGRPKGCMLTHRNLLSEMRALLAAPVGEIAAPGHRAVVFLPLAHVLARSVSLAMFEAGVVQAHWADFGTVAEQFTAHRPDTVLGVPRVFEKVHEAAARRATERGRLAAGVFRFAERTAIAVGRAGERGRIGPVLRMRRALADRLVFRDIRAAFGGHCRWAISGGGALAPELGHFFGGLGLPVYEGYGLTESCAAHTVCGPGVGRVGTVGPPLGGNAVRISDDGEIQLRGPALFAGYWRDRRSTTDAFDDGWFRTGDLGELDADGVLTIVGRSKDVLVTAGGKNVSPAPLEDRLRSHAVVADAVVVGDGRPFVSALVTVDPGVADGLGDVRAAVQDAVDHAKASVSTAESIRQWRLVPRALSESEGELTPTGKVRRSVVLDHFAELVSDIYGRAAVG